ncbi:MAG TPA: DUF4296 domain-containing protein [Saprospiraceae bacterium]|nr:DUF4296 domain-containing protein [Saprospiraceae bacterium]HMX86904.1 DUF4296 domain-containing protein [Saprospiraceae bacterium]HMZ38988.1 DUF4296 domain-containing protein [Saprospiraceae bacterium]HNA65178.1 DUF4296 domain-containing protein [Saprospiraceae bacterium]HNC37688.1 DUF4296 domain-containing protein [Saprospiraceae bacterium]
MQKNPHKYIPTAFRLKRYGRYWCYFLIVLTGSCLGRKTTPTPDLKTMSSVFTEIYYLRAAFETLPSGVRDSMLNHYKSEVLRKYGMTDSAFEHQIALYNANPSALQALEEEVSRILREHINSDSTRVANGTTAKDTMN